MRLSVLHEDLAKITDQVAELLTSKGISSAIQLVLDRLKITDTQKRSKIGESIRAEIERRERRKQEKTRRRKLLDAFQR